MQVTCDRSALSGCHPIKLPIRDVIPLRQSIVLKMTRTLLIQEGRKPLRRHNQPLWRIHGYFTRLINAALVLASQDMQTPTEEFLMDFNTPDRIRTCTAI